LNSLGILCRLVAMETNNFNWYRVYVLRQIFSHKQQEKSLNFIQILGEKVNFGKFSGDFSYKNFQCQQIKKGERY
jgi:hypothetical protein